ncbi:uncharacterized protein PADG_12031 [Paracoccidioides brasiliensis Pb18]|uniref:Complex 1 LYR protein domain-containing protein n=1 Tax=Paracoccidioides brasiliensis (strain Pb18) TaxID=502780 RepID=A0A0A0HWW4_PARBD|nr:uncharacterized protein PADG_12031 [Paracoccidioides brasiliensis Pb18]KGM91890.1 hypothetical protein PADG_12031 [Paracoccidioides brasiliensis Pb18]
MSVATQVNTAFQARSLFRSLLRQSRQFAAYNFREYAWRRTIDAYREHQHETDPRKIQELMQKGIENLRMMKRQTVISQFYQLDKLVVEGEAAGKESGKEGGIVRQKDTGMSFQFRSSRRSQAFAETIHRTRTGQIDHDVFEGFPVRRWIRQTVVISQTPKDDQPERRIGGTQARPELPMPKDSHLLTPTSRALLRAARAGCKYIRPTPRNVEDDEKEIKDADAAVAPPPSERTFTARKWTLLPRHMEPPEVEYLAKRRTGLSSLYGSATANRTIEVQPVKKQLMRKTKFKKVDAATGKVSIYEAWVPEGHKLEGEITEDAEVVAENAEATVVAASPAPGTIVEGVGVVDEEGVVVAGADVGIVALVKKKYPPPKRKAKGIGKGRRKKVMFAPGNGEVVPTAPRAPSDDSQAAGDMVEEVKIENSNITTGSQHEYEDEDEENEGEESDEGEGSTPDSKSAGTVKKPNQDNGNAPEAPEKEELKPPIQEHPLIPEQEQQTDASMPPRVLSSSPDLPLSAASASLTTKPSDGNISPTSESQPTLPTARQIISPTPDTTLSERNGDAAKNGQEFPPSEPLSQDAHTQNGFSAPLPQTPTKADGSEPTSPQPGDQPGSASPHEITPSAAPEASSGTVLFDDGEVDLLGSLEASLDNANKPEAADTQTPSAENCQNNANSSQPETSAPHNPEAFEKEDVEMTG